MKFILILTLLKSTYGGTSIDHIEFNTMRDCQEAGQQYVDSFKRSSGDPKFICVVKNES